MKKQKNIIPNKIGSQIYQDLANDYHAHLLKLGYHPKNSRSRYHNICEFLHWLEQQNWLDITKITTDQINHYYHHLSQRPNKVNKKNGDILSQKTTHNHMRNIKDLFEMLLNQQVITTNPCSTLKFPYPKHQSERTILTREEIHQLYEVTETAKERAILSLSYGCGLRVGELEKCDIQDLRLKDKILIIPEGKNKKRRIVPLSKGVATDLGEYFYYERNLLKMGRDYAMNANNRYAFMLNSRGGRMKKWTYNKHLKTIIQRTENQQIIKKQITIHSLRHSIATHLIEQVIKVEQVRQFLGHSQLETTQLYTHISQEQLKKLVKNE